MNAKINIQIERTQSGYSAYSPEIQGYQINGESLDNVVNEMKEKVRDYLGAEKSASKSVGQSLLELFNDITEDMTEDEIAQLPKDGADQHDHYIYGLPKRAQ